MTQVIAPTYQAESTAKRDVITYLILTLMIAWSCQAAAIFLGVDFNQLDASTPLIWVFLTVTAWAPGLAALVTRLMYRQSLRGLGWGSVRSRFLVLAIVLPILYIFLSYSITWLLVPGSFAPTQVQAEATGMLGAGWAPDGLIVLSYLLLTGMMLIIPIGFFALGEELGWNGLLVPQLARVTSFGYTAFIFGGMWAIYHYPLMIFAPGYLQGMPIGQGVLLNTLVLITLAFTQVWLRLRSGSLWPVVVAHTLWNISIFNVFEPITRAAPFTTYLAGEKGVVTGLVVGVFALLFWWLSGSRDR